MCVCVTKEKQKKGKGQGIYTYKIFILRYWLMGLWRLIQLWNICSVNQQAGIPDVKIQVQRPSTGRIPCNSRDVSHFFCSNFSAIGMRLAHIMKGNLFHSESTDLNVKLHPKTPSKKQPECLTTHLDTMAQTS